MPTRGGQGQKLSRPTPLPGKGVPGEEGGPTGRQGVEIVPAPHARDKGPRPLCLPRTRPRTLRRWIEGDEVEVEEGLEPASEEMEG